MVYPTTLGERTLSLPPWTGSPSGSWEHRCPGLGRGAARAQAQGLQQHRATGSEMCRGEVGTGVPEDPLSHAEFPMSISKVGPQGVQPNAPRFKLQDNTGLYRHQSIPFHLQPSSGLQIFNVLLRGEAITYKSSMRVSVALCGGHTPAGMQIKYVDMSWDLKSVAYRLAPANHFCGCSLL